MNILVLGGSYFLGRHFVNMSCKDNNIFVFNRGNNPLNIPGIIQIVGDRHNSNDLMKIATYEYDAVVDFCAYGKNDILAVVKALSTPPKQYVFISTVDVYRRGTGRIQAEDAPFEDRLFGGPEGEYIAGKVVLEKELRKAAAEYNFKYTIFRPAFIYGPGNYAPREGIYFNWIKQAGQILHPSDATGEFQFVYVLDVAKAVLLAIGNDKAYDEAFNLTGAAIENYDSFAGALEKATEVPFERVDITVSTVCERGIPLPFPLTKEESNIYNGEKALTLIGEYTGLCEGLKSLCD